MNDTMLRRMAFAVSLLCASLSLPASVAAADSPSTNRISRPGTYVGYSEPIYADDFALSSQYIAMRDGTKLAIDICRPKDRHTGKVVETPLPVVWMHTPYNRRYNNTKDKLTVDHYAGTASRLVKYGYVVATVDFRGLYASFGHNEGFNRGEWVGAARRDAYDVTEWLAAQPWSNGNIGMWGCSATGGSQMQAVTVAPPHLKAIFPMSFEFDVYDFRVPGGIQRPSGATPPPGSGLPHEKRDVMAAAVDLDADEALLKEARTAHIGTIEDPGNLPFRDSVSTSLTDEDSRQWWIKSSPSTYLDRINASGIAMYMAVNWDEGSTKPGPFFAINNFTVPAKLVVGPGVHCDWRTPMVMTGFDIVVEELRFFDYWLKGIDNGIMKEDPVYYFTYNAPKGSEWRSAKRWPLPEEKRVTYHLGSGALGTTQPTQFDAKDTASATSSSPTARARVARFVYDTPPLAADTQMTGHPTIDLWVSTTATDGDFVATIQDVAPDGTVASYNTQGQLRASLRRTSKPPYNRLGLPYHRSTAADVAPLVPGEPVELEFAILPISMVFKAGHRIRLVVETSSPGPRDGPAPVVTLYRDANRPSRLTLPIIN